MDLADDLHEEGGRRGQQCGTLAGDLEVWQLCVAVCAWRMADDGYLARERCRCATSAEMEELVVDASARRRQR